MDTWTSFNLLGHDLEGYNVTDDSDVNPLLIVVKKDN